jgi:hypothetical protein
MVTLALTVVHTLTLASPGEDKDCVECRVGLTCLYDQPVYPVPCALISNLGQQQSMQHPHVTVNHDCNTALVGDIVLLLGSLGVSLSAQEAHLACLKGRWGPERLRLAVIHRHVGAHTQYWVVSIIHSRPPDGASSSTVYGRT